MATAISHNADLESTLQSPIVRSSNKREILVSIFKDLNKFSVNLIDTLISNKRVSLLGQVASKYNQLFDALKETQVAKVTTATEITTDLKDKISAKVKELTGKEAEIVSTIDPAIIGGFILRIGDIQYDASIANKLNRLKREFTLN
jgi:F-type H+-transporting ATPase subunit delta